MEEKNSKINYLIYAVFFVIILSILAITGAYAYYKVNVDYDETLSGIESSLECIDLSLDSQSLLSLSYNYPITDELAMRDGSITPVSVTVTNNCSTAKKYTLSLATMTKSGTTYIDDAKIRYKVVKNDSDFKGIDYLSTISKLTEDNRAYGSLVGTDKELATKYPDYTLRNLYAVDEIVTINPNTSNTYEVYLWVDYYEGDAGAYAGNEHDSSFDNTTKGQSFAAAISLSLNGDDEFIPIPVGEYLMANPTTGLNTTEEAGLYRYQGTSVNNYICFGTSDKSTCTGNTDQYMYRIIGINSSGQLKLIKKESFNTAYYWHNTSSLDITWPNSDLYKGLNGISGGQYSNLFIGNTTYVPSGWSEKIATTSWKYGDNTNETQTAANLYTIENGWTTTTSAKIGLMYMHDYFYAYQSGGLNCSYSGESYSTCQTSWLHLSQNDSGAPSALEWTMSRYGYTTGYYAAWSVYSYGYDSTGYLYIKGAVCPVFYLTSDVTYLSGTGTASDPIIIE